MHSNIRLQIYNEALRSINIIPNAINQTERGNYRIHDYIQTINEEGNYGGDFKFSISYDLYNINIAQYIIEKDSNNNIINLKFVKYINGDNQENKNLLILVNESNVHFMVALYNKSNVGYKYIPKYNIDKENNVNNISHIKNNENNIDLNESTDLIKKYNLKDLSKLQLKKILNHYDDNDRKEDNLADIYYFIYYYNINNQNNQV